LESCVPLGMNGRGINRRALPLVLFQSMLPQEIDTLSCLWTPFSFRVPG